MNIIQAVNSALDLALGSDEDVFVFGEDVGKFGGVFRATDGLQATHGDHRVFDTPLSEGGIIGMAIGMAIYGLKPVPEIQFSDFIYPAFDQIVNEMAKFRYRSGGEYPCPVTIRTPFGGGIRGGHYHSQSPEAYFAHTAGLKVVVPTVGSLARFVTDTDVSDRDSEETLDVKLPTFLHVRLGAVGPCNHWHLLDAGAHGGTWDLADVAALVEMIVHLQEIAFDSGRMYGRKGSVK